MLDQGADVLESLDVLGVTPEGEHQLPLLDHRVDATKPVHLGVRQGLKALEGVLEEGLRLGVGPTALRLLGGENGVVDGLLVLAAAAEVVGEQLHHLVQALGVQLLEPERGGGVVLAPPTIEETPVHDVLRERVLEAVHRLGILDGGEDKIEAVEVLEVLDDLIRGARDDTGDERGPEASPHHRSALQDELERVRQPVNARGDDVVDGGGHLDLGAAEARLTALDGDPPGLLELVEDLLDVEGIPLPLLGKDLEEIRGHGARTEDRTGHPLDLSRAEALEGDRVRAGQAGPRHEARPRAQQQEDPMSGQAGRELTEEVGRARVQPVHVLDEEHDRRRPARAQEDIAQEPESPLLELGRRKAFDRDALYGDPDFAKVPSSGLLSSGYAAERRKLIDPRKAHNGQRPGDPWKFEPRSEMPPLRAAMRLVKAAAPRRDSPDTTTVDVADGRGNLFSASPSSAWFFGGVFIAGDTGVPLGNRMQAFVLEEHHPNVVQGGKRPRTTLSPTVVLRDGKPFLALSSPGGDSQDQQALQVFLNIAVFNMRPQEAIEAPRFNSLHHDESFGDHSFQPGVVEVEDRIPPGVVESLRRLGHKVEVQGSFMMNTGTALAGVDAGRGTLFGAADPRRQRFVTGW